MGLVIDHELISEFFVEINSAAIKYVVLRNYEKLPFETENDIDILVSSHDVSEIIVVLNCILLSKGYGDKCTIMHRYGTTTCKVKMATGYLVIDFIWRLAKQWIDYGDVDRVLSRRTKYGDIYVPNRSDEFMSILCKEVYTYGYVRDKYRPKFESMFHAINISDIRDQYKNYFTADSLMYVMSCVDDNNPAPFFNKINIVRKFHLFIRPMQIIQWFYLNRVNVLLNKLRGNLHKC